MVQQVFAPKITRLALMDGLGLHLYGSISVNLVGPMVLTSSRHMSYEDEELDEDGNYLDIIQSPSYSYLKKRFKVRRLICRVCKLKFRTREETQAHIKREHRRIQTET
jgi:hypothetical protein